MDLPERPEPAAEATVRMLITLGIAGAVSLGLWFGLWRCAAWLF